MEKRIDAQLKMMDNELSVKYLENLQDLVNEELFNNNDLDVNEFLNEISYRLYYIVIKLDFDNLSSDQLNTVIMILYVALDYTKDLFDDLATLMIYALNLVDSEEANEYQKSLEKMVNTSLDKERLEIDELDQIIIETLVKRLGIVKKVKIKKNISKAAIEDKNRERAIDAKLNEYNYNENLKKIYQEIMTQSKKIQE